MKVFLQIFILLIYFVTAACSNPPEKIKIAVWGDSRENQDGACERIISILLNDIADWDFMIHTGDFTHAGEKSDWQRSLAYKDMDKIFVQGKFYMCTSNHDDNLETWDKHTAGVLPVNSLNHSTHFYAMQKGNVHAVFCDAYFTNAKVMQKWLDQYLETVPKEDWLIGVWHAPCYKDITYKSSYMDIAGPWLQSLYEHGGDMVLHGHAHVYVRTKPLLPDGTVDEKNGMVHIVNGVGGASWKDPQPVTEKTAYTPDERSFPCITFITIEGKNASIQTIDARPEKELAVIDEWMWKK